jgi:4-amino-4-deoxy-L-arabinose transferase-like glycosyltransferase
MTADACRPPWKSIAFTFLAALAVRGGVAWSTGFDGLYGQDAYYYYEEGRRLAASFRHDGLDSVGYPVLLGITAFLFGQQPEAGQLVGLLLGALTPAAAIWLAWLLTGRSLPALCAGLLVCLTPFHIRSSLVLMSDAPALGLLTLGVCCGVRYVRRPALPWALASGGLLALAVITRYASFLALLPLGVYALACRQRLPGGHLAASGLFGLLICVPELLHMRQHVPSAFLLEGWSPLNALRRQFTTADGILTYDWPVALMNLRTLAGWGFFNPVWSITALAGLWRLRERPPALAFLLVWTGVWFGFMSGLPLVNPRYLLPLIVPLGVCAAAGAAHIGEAVRRRSRLGKGAAGLLVVCGIAGLGLGAYRSVGEILRRKACELEAAAWVNTHIDAGVSLIVAFDVAHAVQHYTAHRVIHLHEFDPERRERSGAEGVAVYLIWNEAHAARVAGRRPGTDDPMPGFAEAYLWLRDPARHTRLARICAWEVIRIRRKDEG